MSTPRVTPGPAPETAALGGAGRRPVDDIPDGPSLDPAAAIVLLRGTPAILEAIVEGFPADLAEERPATDEWSAAEILGHLIEVEEVLFRRVESMIASDQAPASAKPVDSGRPEVGGLLHQWLAARKRTLERLDRLTPADLEHGADLRHWGRVSVSQQVCEWAYHDLEHLRQLLATEEAFVYPSIGGFGGLYPPPFEATPEAAS